MAVPCGEGFVLTCGSFLADCYYQCAGDSQNQASWQHLFHCVANLIIPNINWKHSSCHWIHSCQLITLLKLAKVKTFLKNYLTNCLFSLSSNQPECLDPNFHLCCLFPSSFETFFVVLKDRTSWELLQATTSRNTTNVIFHFTSPSKPTQTLHKYLTFASHPASLLLIFVRSLNVCAQHRNTFWVQLKLECCSQVQLFTCSDEQNLSNSKFKQRF